MESHDQLDIRNSIIRGDALQELQKLADESVELIITDPPYNVDYGYNTYKDKRDDYLEWQLAILAECGRVLKPGGSVFYLNYPEFNSHIWASLPEPLTGQEIIAWVYNTHTGGNPLRKSFRTWIWASKGQPATSEFYGEYKNPTDARVKKLIEAGRRPGEYDWWEFQQVKNVSAEKTEHPCQLPLGMVSKIIAGASKPGDLVLDPFLGSGTIAVAAKLEGRDYLGIELDEDYAALSARRLAATQVQTSLIA
ncbi:UNVERIFIED_ORG: DNA modification methylase [Arthrobacter sp. UYEF1]